MFSFLDLVFTTSEVVRLNDFSKRSDEIPGLEIPATQEDVAGPGEDLSAGGTEAREAPIAEEEAAEGALGVKETEGPPALGEEAAAFVDERDLPVAAGVEEAVVEPEASSVSGKKVRTASEERLRMSLMSPRPW